MVLKTEYAVACVIIALLLGALLKDLQNDYYDIKSELDLALVELSKSERDHEELNKNYLELLDTLGYLDAKNYSRINKFNLTAGRAEGERC